MAVFGMSIFMTTGVGAKEEPPATYRITYIKGPTGFIPEGKKQASPLYKGVPVKEGDRLVTGKKGAIEIATQKGNILKLDEKTNLVVQTMSAEDHSFFLSVGRLLARFGRRVERSNMPSYRVKTPYTVAAIRGTELAIAVDENQKVEAGVIEGKVAFGPIRPPESNMSIQKESEDPQDDQEAEELSDEMPAEAEPDEVIVEQSQGLQVNPDGSHVKLLEIPPVLVPSLEWFENMAEKVKRVEVQWEEFDAGYLNKLREKSLKKKVKWEVPEKVSPSKPEIPKFK